MLSTGRDFFVAFFAILYAGAVPVPIYPPMRMSQLEEHLHRQAAILRNAGARILVTVPEARGAAAFLQAQVRSLTAVESVAGLSSHAVAGGLPVTHEAAAALIQYTSGSTGDPKGVVLSHANLLANIRAIGHAMEASSTDIFVSWLPLYHDMGLIGAWLGCLYFGAQLYIMSPLSFLIRPESWLWAIHQFRATLSGAPNFAFELCLNKIDDSRLQGLDLSSLRMIVNGAEPVAVPTLRRFIERFGPYGFRPGAMAPVYGLAENSVGLAFPPAGRAPVIDRVDREALSRRGAAEPAKEQDPHPLEIPSCGFPLPGNEIRIVDELGYELGERREGRLEFRGPSAASGYFRNETKTRELFHGGWLDSGDRAYMAGGEVYITGRIKDIIIRACQHIYPQEIEEAIAEIPGIRKGCVAVFGTAGSESGTERVVVLAETRESDPAARAALQLRALDVAASIAGTPPDEIVLAPPRTVPKTSSGKIRRSAAKELYEAGRIGKPQRALWWQVLRLWLAGTGVRFSRLTVAARETLYAAWWWIVMLAGFVTAWLIVMLLPQLKWRWRAVRGIARATLAAAGVPVTTEGLDRLPGGTPCSWFSIIRATWTSCFSARFCLASPSTWPSASSLRSSSPGISCAALALCSSSVSTPARALQTRKAPLPPPKKGGISYFSPRAHSPAGPGFPNSIWAPLRWRRKPACPPCLASSVGRGPCCAAISGFRDGPHSASQSAAQSCRPERTSLRCSVCATRRARSCLPGVANRTSANW